MNKNALKNFAIWARRELIKKVTQRATLYGIEKDKAMEVRDVTLNGELISSEEKIAIKSLIKKIQEDGFDETIEEVSYTWFNRIIAIRFMEVNGYMPSHIRVFSSENNEFVPQILTEAINLDLEGLDKEKVFKLYNDGNKDEKLFNYLFLTQCNALNDILPGMFEKIKDYKELLLPSGLLRENSIIDVMIKEIPQEDFKDQVQIIGWLYQYYNSEPKDEVFSRSKSKKIEKEDIPAATQLFTPDWIVRYMVENSLGRLWIEGHPDDEIKSNWKYYLEEANQVEEVEQELRNIREEYQKIEPEEIKCIDPAIGSGHIGVYLFDVLMRIYESCGYKKRDAVRLILEKNIIGLDIDERARQLAYFSLMMKARGFDRRFLDRDYIPQPKVYTFLNSNSFKSENGERTLEYFANGNEDLRRDVESLIDNMVDADEYGSILVIDQVDFDAIYRRIEEIKKDESSHADGFVILKFLKPLINQAKILSDKYDVVVTNPPYMGSSRMNSKLSKYLKKNYKDSKSDLFAVFMEKWNTMLKQNRFNAMVTMQSWMFLSSFEKMRENILNNLSIVSLMHMENMVMRIAFGTSATIFRNTAMEKYRGNFNNIKFSDIVNTDQDDEPFEFPVIENKNTQRSIENFKKIPDMRIGYWVSPKTLESFKFKSLGYYGYPKQGLATGKNTLFLRQWHEIYFNKIGFRKKNRKLAKESGKKWFPCNKGGSFRRWYGNNNIVVNWENDGFEIRNFVDDKGKLRSRPQNMDFYFKAGITWSTATAKNLSMRYSPEGFLFETKGSVYFVKDKSNLLYILGLMNSFIINNILQVLSPTLDYHEGPISQVPVIIVNKLEVENYVRENLKIAILDWDMHETSWDFKTSPLLKNKSTGRIEDAYESYKKEVNERFETLKSNEEELNKIFINIYGFEDELTPEVSDRDITVAKIFDEKKNIYEEIKGNKYIMTREDVVKNFLSYFIGCLMGRYSLDEEGLVLAGGDFDSSKYKRFAADKDGIIPLTDHEYLEDDILNQFIKFMEVTFGEEYLDENLDFIAKELKGKKNESSKERIRNYFVNDFYKDHLQMYKKLPIYWQYDSGKEGACKGLFYLHRYNKDTFAKIRINYVFEIQDRYKQELNRLESSLASIDKSEKVKTQKEINLLKKKLQESQDFEEKVQHIADSYIEIDLDDGVEENYKIFQDVLSKRK